MVQKDDVQEVRAKGAATYKVQTLVDGGFRLTIDVPETEIIPVAQVMQYQIDGVSYDIVFIPDIPKNNRN